jgi:hypothetical protein
LAVSYWLLAISYFHNIFCCQNGGFTTLGDKWLRRIVSKHTAKQTFGDSGSKYKFLQQNKKTA